MDIEVKNDIRTFVSAGSFGENPPKLKKIFMVLQCQKHKSLISLKYPAEKKVFFLSSKYIVETCADFGFFSIIFSNLMSIF